MIHYAKPIVAELRANMVRVDSDFSATPFKAKISNAEQWRVHTMLTIGGHDVEAGQISVRLHHGGPQVAKPKAKVVADILASIKGRRASFDLIGERSLAACDDGAVHDYKEGILLEMICIAWDKACIERRHP